MAYGYTTKNSYHQTKEESFPQRRVVPALLPNILSAMRAALVDKTKTYNQSSCERRVRFCFAAQQRQPSICPWRRFRPPVHRSYLAIDRHPHPPACYYLAPSETTTFPKSSGVKKPRNVGHEIWPANTILLLRASPKSTPMPMAVKEKVVVLAAMNSGRKARQIKTRRNPRQRRSTRRKWSGSMFLRHTYENLFGAGDNSSYFLSGSLAPWYKVFSQY